MVDIDIGRKLEILSEEYKFADVDTVKEILLVCEGSINQARSILNESFERNPSSKHGLYQSSVMTMFQSSKKRKIIEPEQNERTKIITIYDESQVEELLHPYVSLHKNFLPHTLSNKLLQYLLDNKQNFKPKEFYLFDKKCVSNHDSGLLYFANNFNKEQAIYNGETSDCYKLDNKLMDVSTLINNYVNEKIIPNYKKLPFQQSEFESSVCVVNHYSEMSKNLDWHSDRLQNIGPHCFIASMSLGATREFRLRRHSQPKIIYSIHLPHNCLLLMHPGCQELFKHSVNPMKKPLQLNAISGSSRFNLTFRYFPPNFINNAPKCKCKLPMMLRRSYKSPNDKNFGKYHWTCENIYRNKDCNTFHWANFNDPEHNFISDNDESTSKWVVK